MHNVLPAAVRDAVLQKPIVNKMALVNALVAKILTMCDTVQAALSGNVRILYTMANSQLANTMYCTNKTNWTKNSIARSARCLIRIFCKTTSTTCRNTKMPAFCAKPTGLSPKINSQVQAKVVQLSKVYGGTVQSLIIANNEKQILYE